MRSLKSKNSEKENLSLLEQLRKEVKLHPDQKISNFLHSLSTKHELSFDSGEEEDDQSFSVTETKKIFTSERSANSDLDVIWRNWYSHNSINLLLYVGAFLIVASASIFVGFQWQTIDGVIKAAVISLCMLGFLGFGVWFYYIPKIRNAGVTFTAIAALLIPFVGYAWYNFVLKNLGLSFGSVWLVTSVISLLAYLSFSFWQKNKFYAYTSALGVFSMMLSLVNVYGLDSKYYIVSGIFSTFILLAARLLLKTTKYSQTDHLIQPLELSENILLPLTAIYGFSIALSENMVFSLEVTISLFMTTLYYFCSYLLTRRPIHLTLSAILFPITLAVFYTWQDFIPVYLGYILNLVAGFYLLFGLVFSKNNRQEETDINIILSLLLTIIIFIVAFFGGSTPIDRFVFALIPAMIAIGCSYIKRNPYFLGISALFAGIAGYLFINQYLQLPNGSRITSFYFLFLSSAAYIAALYFKDNEKIKSVALPTIVIYSISSLALVFNEQLYLLLEYFFIAGLAFAGAIHFSKKDLIYLSNFLLNLGLFTTLGYLKIENTLYPFFFSGTGLLFYFISFTLPEELSSRYRNSGFTELMVTPLMYGLGAGSYYYSADAVSKIYEQNSLICAYLASGIAAFDAFRSKESLSAYFASAVAMTTILWQIKYLNFSDAQFYAIPLGIYFFGLAYSRKIKDDQANRQLLDIVGLVIWLLPTLVQAFDLSGAKYGLILGFEGVILLLAGITMQYRLYMYGGIIAIVLAVFSQTYNYLFSLPRWLITGLAGLIFLVVATTLLLKRKDETQGKE